jgi:hypothetical protein
MKRPLRLASCARLLFVEQIKHLFQRFSDKTMEAKVLLGDGASEPPKQTDLGDCGQKLNYDSLENTV